MWIKKTQLIAVLAIMAASMMLVVSGLHAPRVALAATLTDSSCTAASYAGDLTLAGANGTITFNCFSPADILVPATTSIGAATNLTITSVGAAVTLDGGGTLQVFDVTGSSASLTLENLTVANGLTNGGGGGLANHKGTVNIINSTFSGNRAYYGGALYNGGDYTGTATMNISNSTIAGNSILYSYGNGAGLYNDMAAIVNVKSSTISDNSTLSPGNAGGLWNVGSATIANSIVANNTSASNPNCYIYGPLTDLGYNLESGTDCGFTGTGSKQNTDPMLGALASNGGPTKTMALMAGSPAIDTVPVASCLASDQRGNPRPDNTAEAACDMGAYESGEDADLALSGVPESFSVNATSPAGAVVSYSLPTVIDEDGTPPTVDCSPAPGSAFAIGVTTVTCTVTDPDDTNSPVTQSFAVTVNGAASQLGDLLATVNSYDLANGLQTSLLSQLQAARADLQANNQVDACGVIGAFVNHVKAQSNKGLTSAQGAELLTDSQRIRSVLAC